MSTAYNDYAKELAQANARYGKYAAAYNEQFSCDPNPVDRTFSESAPPDAKQWSRLENFRGNDRDARAAYLDHPHASTQPTPKEEKMWELNQSRNWDIDRQPDPYLDHANSKNKWLPPMAADREQNREKANAYAERIEQQYGAQYDAYAAKAGNQAVDKFDYLNTMAVVEGEKLRAQSQKQTHSEQQGQAQPPPAQAQAPVQEAPAAKTRLSVANFQQAPEAYIDDRVKAMEGKSDGELKQVQATAESEYQALSKAQAESGQRGVLGQGTIAEDVPKIAEWNSYKAKENEQLEHKKQDVLEDSQSQRQTRTQ